MAKARIGHFVECQVCLNSILISHRHDRPERSGSIDPT
jgi:pyridoxal biosynthesis lyase PdxS